MKNWFLKYLINVYPPYWGTGISVTDVSPDFREATVQMKMRWYNRNYVNTHFGGSLYAMTDPFFMLMLIHILGDEYIVWDKSASIDFLKPCRGKVTAQFVISEEQIEKVIEKTGDGQKYLPEFRVEIKNEGGEEVARVVKTLYVRRKVHTLKDD